ncbi:MAG: antibiotic biosynthesis monooxygenase [Kordiimonadaceae bacterium]|nr:antibiotic biosynthesis monooxygenase [Kordiimonadaceae bacterium]MBO6569400.1 antibiotic biosynthesis monooxygenase [Kordiimonadaceae bacterium]MBO6964875.1 antibiotic biosynthesis monooxygenase [Kordiimonadaceae bacterium]
MIRVIYRWNVSPERKQEFADAWQKATRAIHGETPGALGSFCLENIEDVDEVLTVALWHSEQQWRDFIGSAKQGPMAALHDIGTLLSTTPYNQLGDETVALEL